MEKETPAKKAQSRLEALKCLGRAYDSQITETVIGYGVPICVDKTINRQNSRVQFGEISIKGRKFFGCIVLDDNVEESDLDKANARFLPIPTPEKNEEILGIWGDQNAPKDKFQVLQQIQDREGRVKEQIKRIIVQDPEFATKLREKLPEVTRRAEDMLKENQVSQEELQNQMYRAISLAWRVYEEPKLNFVSSNLGKRYPTDRTLDPSIRVQVADLIDSGHAPFLDTAIELTQEAYRKVADKQESPDPIDWSNGKLDSQVIKGVERILRNLRSNSQVRFNSQAFNIDYLETNLCVLIESQRKMQSWSNLAKNITPDTQLDTAFEKSTEYVLATRFNSFKKAMQQTPSRNSSRFSSSNQVSIDEAGTLPLENDIINTAIRRLMGSTIGNPHSLPLNVTVDLHDSAEVKVLESFGTIEEPEIAGKAKHFSPDPLLLGLALVDHFNVSSQNNASGIGYENFKEKALRLWKSLVEEGDKDVKSRVSFLEEALSGSRAVAEILGDHDWTDKVTSGDQLWEQVAVSVDLDPGLVIGAREATIKHSHYR